MEQIAERWLRHDSLSGHNAVRLETLLLRLADLYRSHIAIEEQESFPVAQAQLSDSAKQLIGRRMASRRGVPFIPGNQCHAPIARDSPRKGAVSFGKESAMKFLVIWHLDVSRLTPEVIKAVMEQPNYGKKLQAEKKLECRYHIGGSHGGAWI